MRKSILRILETGVIGTGLMGSGIAAVFAAGGRRVRVYDTDVDRIRNCRVQIGRIVEELGNNDLLDSPPDQVIQRVAVARELHDLQTCQFVMEAIPEDLELKHQLYRRLEQVIPHDTILASNTSGLMPSHLIKNMEHPDRFLVAHFWNPPHAIPLVEVVPSAKTGAGSVETVLTFLRDVGAEPVLISKELPGFIGNRLQYAVLREALAIVRSGAATPEAVDLVMKASLGRRYATVGPIETADLGGLDTFLSIASHLMPELAKDEDVLDLIRERVKAGKIGLRSGEGFYPWPKQQAQRVLARRNQDLLRRRVADRESSLSRSPRKLKS
ncbi:MAG: 3-hydroxyacyl-CoA dehydrogenase family protein [Chthoniobacterales bacterium]